MDLELIDVGANLTHASFLADRAAVIERARAAGVSTLIVTGASAEESRAAYELARTNRALYSTAGVHPHLAGEWSESTANALRDLASHPEVVAVGETGLDFNRDFSPRPAQEQAFAAQLELAAELELPVFMHERDAHERFLDIVAAHRHRIGKAVIHCFTGSAPELRAYLDLDLHVGITGWICDERRGLHLRELVGEIPGNRLMLETDAPYLLPRDLAIKPKTRRNEPMYLRHILDVVAACRGTSSRELARVTSATAREFFGLR